MTELKTIIGHVGGRCKGEYAEQKAWDEAPADSSDIKAEAREHVEEMLAFLEKDDDTRRFDQVERDLRTLLFTLGRLLIAYYLARREERSAGELAPWLKKGYRRRDPERKYLHTFFGRVCFWRTYLRGPGGLGFHPLDLALGLTADGFSFWIMEMCARLSTFMPYEQVTAILLYFLSWSPSKTTVEKAVLGFGRHTREWFETAPPPEGDGEVLVIQVDTKAVPTATEEELKKRRGKRRKERSLSPRHRGRAKRARRGPKKRRKKGDKSKNGKAATIVTLYTLKKGRGDKGRAVLLGPINKRVYATYASKRHAFVWARTEADKRGFPKGCGKTVQIVTDGDEDLERYAKDFFPEAKHTLDIMHVLEYVWEAGRFRFREGSRELLQWVKQQEKLLYGGKAVQVVRHIGELERRAGPRNRERLDQIQNYLSKRLHMMDYHKLRKQDLEVASGVVEGAVRHVISKRFDNGSMRWIKERAEPLLQLRCIEINGDWDAFVAFVHRRLRAAAKRERAPLRLLTKIPAPLLSLGINPCNVAA